MAELDLDELELRIVLFVQLESTEIYNPVYLY